MGNGRQKEKEHRETDKLSYLSHLHLNERHGFIPRLNSDLFSQIFAVSENPDAKAPIHSTMDTNTDSWQALCSVDIKLGEHVGGRGHTRVGGRRGLIHT